MSIRKTKSGWVIEITNTCYGMLEQGGICGKEVLVKTTQLSQMGYNYNDDPQSDAGLVMPTTIEDYLYQAVITNPEGYKVLKKGRIIQ